MSFNNGTMRIYRRAFVTVSVLCVTVNLPLCHALCKAGEFLSPSSGRCEPCASSSFRSETNHNNTSCLQCTENAPTSAELRHPCNATHNTVYRCVNETFNHNGHDVLCQKCRLCQYPGGISCSHDHDAVCCLNESLTVVPVESNENCIHKSTHEKYCCVESELTTVKGDILSDVTQTEIPEVQEQNSTSKNKLMPDIHNNGDLSAGKIAAITAGCIAFIAVIAATIWVVYRLRQRLRHLPNYHLTASKNIGNDQETANL